MYDEGASVTKARRMTRTRWIALGVVLALIVALGINALVMSAETKPAQADIGRLVGARRRCVAGAHRRPRRRSRDRAAARLRRLAALVGKHVRLLDAHYRVLRFDLLGHGGSSKPSSGYSMEHQAQLVDEALHQLGRAAGPDRRPLDGRPRGHGAGHARPRAGGGCRAGGLPAGARAGSCRYGSPGLRAGARAGAALGGDYERHGQASARERLRAGLSGAAPVRERLLADDLHLLRAVRQGRRHVPAAESLAPRLTALGVPLLGIYGTRDRDRLPREHARGLREGTPRAGGGDRRGGALADGGEALCDGAGAAAVRRRRVLHG